MSKMQTRTVAEPRKENSGKWTSVALFLAIGIGGAAAILAVIYA